MKSSPMHSPAPQQRTFKREVTLLIEEIQRHIIQLNQKVASLEQRIMLSIAEAEARQRDRADALRAEFATRIGNLEAVVASQANQLKASASTVQASKYSTLPSTKELEALLTTLQPHAISKYLREVESALKRYPEVELLFQLSPAELRSAKSTMPASDYESLLAADEFLARVFKATIDSSAKHASLFKSQMLHEDPDASSSGVGMLARIRHFRVSGGGSAHGQNVKNFADESFFSAGQSEMEARAAAELLVDYYDLIPIADRAPGGVLRAMLKKAPASIAESVKSLERDLFKAERLSTSPPWTAQELGDLLAYDIGQSSKAHRSINLTNYEGKCHNCGGNHHPKDCAAKGICGLSFCPCVRNEACVVRCAKAVPANVNNIFGKPLPDYIIKRLSDAQAKWAQKNVNAAEAEVQSAELEEPFMSFGGELAYFDS